MLEPNFRMMLAAGSVVLALLAAPVSAQKVGTSAFPETALIEKQLKRGVTTKADVQRLLGVPNGRGRSDMARPARLAAPPLGDGPREIWFYDDIEVTDMKSGDGVVNMNLRQQILLVFFNGEIFDGYLWTTNALTGTAE